MNLGNTIEEKREGMELLNRGAKKLAKVFAFLGLFGTVGMIALVSQVRIEPPYAKILLIIIFLTYPFVFYWSGKFWYYGFVTVIGWMTKLGLTGGDVISGAASAITVSYILSGRRGAKVTGIIFLVVLAITLIAGFYVGLFNYYKIRGQIKKAYAE